MKVYEDAYRDAAINMVVDHVSNRLAVLVAGRSPEEREFILARLFDGAFPNLREEVAKLGLPREGTPATVALEICLAIESRVRNAAAEEGGP